MHSVKLFLTKWYQKQHTSLLRWPKTFRPKGFDKDFGKNSIPHLWDHRIVARIYFKTKNFHLKSLPHLNFKLSRSSAKLALPTIRSPDSWFKNQHDCTTVHLTWLGLQNLKEFRFQDWELIPGEIIKRMISTLVRTLRAWPFLLTNGV